ncbi:hypothetical protein F5I97DRAFT_1978297 [Phlebopus sp. FC_14]|nr:hypothetical protein F5I97DRAFT_1978297 [Phlebopus sp. FC_14]
MARKTKTRFTRKKQQQNKLLPDGPTRSEWEAFQRFRSFIVHDNDGDKHEFKLGDTAYIVPYKARSLDNSLSWEEHWIAKIREIAAANAEEVWVRVQWFWSPDEVSQVIKSFHPEFCGQYEKIFSDNHDIISSQCFAGLVEVKRYNEQNLEQLGIGDDDWFFRYNFEYTAKRINPKVATVACICGKPYAPGTDEIVHFCPRPTCRTGYHQSCLLERGFEEPVSMERSYQLLQTWAETVATAKSLVMPPLKKHQKTSTEMGGHADAGPSAESPFAYFPSDLLAIAQQQIIKGTKAGGIVGNVAPVVAARSIIYRSLTGDGSMPENWENMLDLGAAPAELQQGLPGLLCPGCGSPI